MLATGTNGDSNEQQEASCQGLILHDDGGSGWVVGGKEFGIYNLTFLAHDDGAGAQHLPF